MRYHVTIGDRNLEVDLTGPNPVVDGREVRAQIATIPGTHARHLLIDAESRSLIAEPGPRRGLWKIGIGGNTLAVEVIDERTRAIREMAGTPESAAQMVVIAPMPGLVLRVDVEPGQQVSAGQGVVVVEAMKMENELKAPADGTVARIEVSTGQAVEKGTVLIVLE
jgi:acetyl/propionyl-CoA carboxylase alpha subunit